MTAADTPLSSSFYQRSAIAVARDLLGCHLMRRVGRSTSILEISETEAYLGAVDPASHAAFGRRTERVEPMYGPPGHAYVYFVYGMHWCMNVVCAREGVAEAVLLRAGTPVKGEATMRRRRGLATSAGAERIAGGPAMLCQAMAIDGRWSGRPLNGAGLVIAAGLKIQEREVVRGPRVGVDYAGTASEWPLRYRVVDGDRRSS